MHPIINTPMDLAVFLFSILLSIVAAFALIVIAALLGAFVYGAFRYGPAIVKELRAKNQPPAK